MTQTRAKKPISEREKEFARLMVEAGLGSIEAYRAAFNVPCQDKKSQQRAKDLARSARVKKHMMECKEIVERQKQAQTVIHTTGDIDIDRIREFAFNRLLEIRDDPYAKAHTRFQAVKALEILHDPAADANLIWMWIHYAWQYQRAHCPCCHEDFNLSEIKNEGLEKWRADTETQPIPTPEDVLGRRLVLIAQAEKRLQPHVSQRKALEAPERHIVGQGAARGGKSFLLALFALLGFMLPGVEIWILARIYEDAKSEVEYLKKFLRTLFYPHYDLLIKEISDKSSGEVTFLSRWGSELKIRSAKSKGSITGRELEVALVAEPGWVPEDIYEELRARMSSRLGRIIALGTPKGTSGIIGRMVNMTGRDPKTGRIIRRPPHERLISAGSDWNTSMLVYKIKPEDNPGYVKSELDAARQELTDAEYASEFAGEMVGVEGAKFGNVQTAHCRPISIEFFQGCHFVLGIDQGPKNFGACLVAFNGDVVVPCWEYFNGDETTMKRNLLTLRERVPRWIQRLGGNPANWDLTIVDVDPQLDGTFDEMGEERLPWPTDLAFRHRNNTRMNENWRRDLQEWVNNIAVRGKLLFHESDEYNADLENESPGAVLLHDQVMNALDIPENREKESKSDSNKGWTIKDVWRGDHVVDAWYFALWTILTGQIVIPEFEAEKSSDPWFEQKAAFDFQLAQREARELGMQPQHSPKFEEYFGRTRPGHGILSRGGWYSDES